MSKNLLITAISMGGACILQTGCTFKRKEPYFELFDLSVDESETNNIAPDYPEIEKEMRSLFRDARTEFYIPLVEFSKYYPEGLQRAF